MKNEEFTYREMEQRIEARDEVIIQQRRDITSLRAVRRIKRQQLAPEISGALKSAIEAHGPITVGLIESATKRVLGAVQDLLIEE